MATRTIKQRQEDAREVAKGMNAAQKNRLTTIKDRYPKKDKNSLSSIRDKSSTGVNKDALKDIKSVSKKAATKKTVAGTGVSKLKNKLY